MNASILKSLKSVFLNDYSKKTDFVCTDQNISAIFDIVNDSGIFSPKLNKDVVLLRVVDPSDTQRSKGDFFELHYGTYNVAINIVRSPIGDNFSKIVSTLCHEMIHMYDYFYGPMKDALDGCSMKVSKLDKRQVVNGRYDAHGRFFQKYISKFSTFGITVKVSYSPNDKVFMKKMQDNKEVNFFGELMTESTSKDDVALKKQLEKRANSIKGVKSNGELIFVDKDHWAIRID